MKLNFKNLLLTMAVLLCSLSASARGIETDGASSDDITVVASGYINNLWWKLTSDSVLTFSGTAEIPAYNPKYLMDSQPWREYTAATKKIVISSGIPKIRERAFEDYVNVVSVTLPKGLKMICEKAFKGCGSLTDINIPESVFDIGRHAFYYCSSLKSVTIKGATIADYAFESCSNLTNITISGNISKIYPRAFAYCSKLDTVTSYVQPAPSLLSDNYGSVFTGISKTAILRYPAGCDYSAWEPYFAKSEPIYEAIAEGTCGDNLTWTLMSDSTLTISGSGAMTDYNSGATPWSSYSSQITNVVIEDGVTSIGVRAFNSLTKLTSISIPASVAKIGHRAFFGCSSLTAITIPDAVTSIEEKTFDGCGKLAEVNLGSGVQTIKNSAFYGCRALTSLTLPASLTTIGTKAFYYCSNLATTNSLAITAPTLQSSDAFTNIPTTATLRYPYGSDYSAWKEYFGKSVPAFYGAVAEGTCGDNLAWGLTSDGTLTIIGSGAMTDFGSVATPWNSYNSQINNVVIEDGVTSIGVRAFNGCTKLTSISIPASVSKIGHRAFFGCSSLAAITIPDAVTSIEEKTFDGCGKLATVTLGSGLKAIKNSAFNGNRSLATITLRAEVPPTLGTSAFAYTSATAALHLPAGTVKAYKAAGWTMFTNIISPCTLTATVNDAAMGSVALSDSVVNYGSSATVQITPAENYKLKTITVNGTDVTTLVEDDGTYTIAPVEENIAIAVEFEKADNCTITLDDVTTTFGAMIDLPIAMTNTYDVTAMQMDITLPEGITPVTDDDGTIIATLNPDRTTDSHSITASQMADGTVKVVVFSSDNAPLKNSNGTIVTLKVHVLPDETTESGTIILSNIRVVTPDAREIKVADAEATLNIRPLTFIPGDANMSGTVTVSDIVATINQMFGKPQAAFSFDAADMNGDGEISIVDVVNIVNAIIATPAVSDNTRARIRAAANGESIRSEVSTDGDNTLMSLSLNGSAAYTAMQMDVELPEGATLVAATSGDDSHTIAWNRLDNGTVRIVAYSLSSATFDGETLLTLEVENANGTISVDNVSVATTDGVETSIGGTSADVNGTTGIGGTAEEIVSVRYFNEAGAELDEPQKGINIVVTEYAGGRIESKKVLKK